MPIDDSDMGCDCAVKCEISAPWKRQIAAVTIDDQRDAVTDNGQELVNLFAERGVDNVIIELTQREVLIMDGSSAPFLFLIQEAGLKKQSAARGYLKVLRPFSSLP